MNIWIAYALALCQILMLYWVSPGILVALMYRGIFSKNTDWVREHPDFHAQHSSAKWGKPLFYLLGAGWLGCLLWYTPGLDARRAILFLTAPSFVWTWLVMGYAGLAWLVTARQIPLPTKRRTSLQRRALADFIHPVLVWLAYGLLALVAGVYALALYRGQLGLDVVGPRMIGLCVFLLLASVSLWQTLRRKTTPLDEAWGPALRQWVIRCNVGLLYLGVAIGGWRILQDLYAISLFDDLTLFALFGVALQGYVLMLVGSPTIKRLLAQPL